MPKVDRLTLEWQRRLDPSNFNKATGAQFHTAPAVIMPGSPDIPEDAPEGSVTMMFFIDGECWIDGNPQRVSVDSPSFMERPPRTKSAKHGPVIVLSDTAALCAIPVSQNYYWAAQVMCSQDVWRVLFVPDRVASKKGRKPRIKVIVTFVPSD